MFDVVIGGNGFIGTAVVDALLAAGRTVRVLDRERSGGHPHAGHPNLEQLVGDFRDPGAIELALHGARRVFHFASTTVPKSSDDDPQRDVSDNLVGSIRLLDACVENRVERVVFLSSGGTVYGVPRTRPITEDHPTDPVVSYGIHKLAVEKYLELYRRSRGLDYIALRLANPYGPRQEPRGSQGAIAAFMWNCLQGKPIEIWGDGSVTRDYVYIDDVADAILKAADYRGDHRLMNIGSGVGVSLLGLVAEIQEVLGETVPCTFKPGRPFDIPVNVLDCQRARRELSWQPDTSLRTGLERTRDWLRLRLT